MKNKAELRIKIKEYRKALDIQTKSRIISGKIRISKVFQKSKNILLFYPTKYEVNLLDLISENKNFYFPKVKGHELLVCPACEEFEKSSFNIMEPCSKPVKPDIIDLVIVPALAVDKDNYRLGYGGGFYDRFLAEYNNLTTLTPIFKEFIFDELPKCDYDIKINYVISD